VRWWWLGYVVDAAPLRQRAVSAGDDWNLNDELRSAKARADGGKPSAVAVTQAGSCSGDTCRAVGCVQASGGDGGPGWQRLCRARQRLYGRARQRRQSRRCRQRRWAREGRYRRQGLSTRPTGACSIPIFWSHGLVWRMRRCRCGGGYAGILSSCADCGTGLSSSGSAAVHRSQPRINPCEARWV
jgi:hypothetical protein